MTRTWIPAAGALAFLGCARPPASTHPAKTSAQPATRVTPSPTGPVKLPLRRKFALECPSIGYVSGKHPYVYIVCDPADTWITASTPRGDVVVQCGEILQPDGPPAAMLHNFFVDVAAPRDVPILLVPRLDTGLRQTMRFDLFHGHAHRELVVRSYKATGDDFGKVWLSGGATHLGWWCGT